MYYVLISAATEDEAFALQLKETLEQSEILIKVDPPDTELSDVLADVGQVVVVLSEHTQNDARVQQVIAFAHDNELDIVPIRHRFAPLPLTLQQSPIIDMQSHARTAQVMSGLVDVLRSKQSLDDVVIPQNVSITDTRGTTRHDIRRYLSVLTVISAPIAAADGENPPQEISNGTLPWLRLASAFAGLQADGHSGLFLQRLLPPTAGNLSETLESNFDVLHITAPAYDGGLLLENSHGHEAPLYPQHLTAMLQDSTTSLLILHSNLRANDCEIMLEETPLKAILMISPAVDIDPASQFSAALVASLNQDEALQTAIETHATSLGIAQDDLQLFTPEATDFSIASGQASSVLIDDGLPHTINVAFEPEFVGQRQALTELSQEIASSDYRQIAIYGGIESGKSWLAAEYVARNGWRYPDGILWQHISARTKSEDVIGQILGLLDLPPTTHWNTLRDILREKRILIVLDQLDQWDDPLEVGELADFIARLDHLGGTRILLTSWGPVQPITYTTGTEENLVEALAQDEAQHLVQQYSDLYALHKIFNDEPVTKAFTEVTLYQPWLIREAIQIVRREGLAAALEAIKELTRDVSDAFEAHMIRQISSLSPDATRILHKLQGLPAGFPLTLLQAINPELAPSVVQELLRLDMLQRKGNLYTVPLIIKIYLRQYLPLSVEEQDDIDAIVIETLVGEA